MTIRRELLDRIRDLTARWTGGPKPAAPPSEGLASPVRPNRMIVSGPSPLMDFYRPFEQAHRVDPRMRLWRDTAAVLAVFAVGFAAWSLVPPGEQGVLAETGAPTHVGSPEASLPGSSITAPSPSLEPSATAGPSVPGTTPAPTPRPTPRATPRPSPSPNRTAAPTAAPTSTPEPTSNPTEPPPTAPPVVASFAVSCDIG